VVDVENSKWRSPLHLAFTPPTGTYCAAKFGGLDENGVPRCERPEEIQLASDWILPGMDEERKQIIRTLVEMGDADVNKLDFHNYSPLLFAVVWGWCDIIQVSAYQTRPPPKHAAAARTAAKHCHPPFPLGAGSFAPRVCSQCVHRLSWSTTSVCVDRRCCTPSPAPSILYMWASFKVYAVYAIGVRTFSAANSP